MAQRLLDRLFSLPFLTVVMALMAVANLVVVANYLLGLDAPLTADGQIAIGDYPAFHTGATLVADGNGESLYDLDVQLRTQKQLIGDDAVSWQGYINPPLLAVLLSPLGSLDVLASMRVFGLVVAVAVALTFALWKQIAPAIADRRFGFATVVVSMIAWSPFARLLPGGQTAPLALLAMTIAYDGERRNDPIRTGIAVGLLSYKPQLAVVISVALVLRQRWKALAIALGVGMAHAAIGGIVVGWDWPVRYLEALDRYGPAEAASNAQNQISAWGALDFAVGGIADGWLATALAVGVAVAVTADLWRRRPSVDRADVDTSTSLWWASALTAAVFVSPHTLYYDVVLLGLPILIAIDALIAPRVDVDRQVLLIIRLGLVAVWLGHLTLDLHEALGFQPMALLPPSVYLWLRFEQRRHQGGSSLPVTPAAVVTTTR